MVMRNMGTRVPTRAEVDQIIEKIKKIIASVLAVKRQIFEARIRRVQGPRRGPILFSSILTRKLYPQKIPNNLKVSRTP